MSKKESKDLNVSKGFAELEQIAAWFEQGNADLDTGLEKFERAMLIADQLKQRLSEAENKVREIKRKYNVE